MSLLKNIFLAEDDKEDQEIFTTVLKEIDQSIVCEIAENGRDALVRLRKRTDLPDIIFLDLNMPLMNGFECLSKLKNEKKLSGLPVVIFTTSNNPQEAQATHQLGANVFLSKPPTMSELRSKVERILKMDFKGGKHGYVVQYSV